MSNQSNTQPDWREINDQSKSSNQSNACPTCNGTGLLEFIDGQGNPTNGFYKCDDCNGTGRKSEPNYYCGAIAEGGYACFLPNPCKKHKGKSDPTFNNDEANYTFESKSEIAPEHTNHTDGKYHSSCRECWDKWNALKSEPKHHYPANPKEHLEPVTACWCYEPESEPTYCDNCLYAHTGSVGKEDCWKLLKSEPEAEKPRDLDAEFEQLREIHKKQGHEYACTWCGHRLEGSK